MYTASAPALIAAMPWYRFLAGVRISIFFLMQRGAGQCFRRHNAVKCPFVGRGAKLQNLSVYPSPTNFYRFDFRLSVLLILHTYRYFVPLGRGLTCLICYPSSSEKLPAASAWIMETRQSLAPAHACQCGYYSAGVWYSCKKTQTVKQRF